MKFEIAKFFNQLGRGTFIDSLSRLISNISFLAFFWIAIAVLIFFLDNENGLMICSTLAISFGMHLVFSAGLIKGFFGRYFKKIRPYLAYSMEIFPLGKKEIDSSFPSGHMSANTSIASVIAYFYPSTVLAIVVLTLFLGYSRIHNGMHYLSDVIFGIFLGSIYGLFSIYLINLYYHYVFS